jgi:hypothetical protein
MSVRKDWISTACKLDDHEFCLPRSTISCDCKCHVGIAQADSLAHPKRSIYLMTTIKSLWSDAGS